MSAPQRIRNASAMSPPLDDRQALACVILWKAGHFDTQDIAELMSLGEDAVHRTISAARAIERGGYEQG